MFISRIQKSYTHNERVLTDSLRQLFELKQRISVLEKELSEYKSLDYRTKSKSEVINAIVEDYFSGIDGDVANERLKDAEAFLNEELLVPQEEIDRRDRLEVKLDYHRVDVVLEEIEALLTSKAEHTISSGLREYKIDRDFAEKLRKLFEG